MRVAHEHWLKLWSRPELPTAEDVGSLVRLGAITVGSAQLWFDIYALVPADVCMVLACNPSAHIPAATLPRCSVSDAAAFLQESFPSDISCSTRVIEGTETVSCLIVRHLFPHIASEAVSNRRISVFMVSPYAVIPVSLFRLTEEWPRYRNAIDLAANTQQPIFLQVMYDAQLAGDLCQHLRNLCLSTLQIRRIQRVTIPLFAFGARDFMWLLLPHKQSARKYQRAKSILDKVVRAAKSQLAVAANILLHAINALLRGMLFYNSGKLGAAIVRDSDKTAELFQLWHAICTAMGIRADNDLGAVPDQLILAFNEIGRPAAACCPADISADLLSAARVVSLTRDNFGLLDAQAQLLRWFYAFVAAAAPEQLEHAAPELVAAAVEAYMKGKENDRTVKCIASHSRGNNAADNLQHGNGPGRSSPV